MDKTKDGARGHLWRALAALLSVALATGGPWQVALAEGVTTDGDVAAVEEPVALVAQASDVAYYDPTEATANKNKTKGGCSELSTSVPGMTVSAGWYTFSGDPTYSGRITISGDVNLILPDGHTMTCNDGIFVPEGSNLTVWAQSTDNKTMGRLIVSVSELKAGIGAVEYEKGGTVTINGGHVEATGGRNCAGIGGAYRADAGPITINGGYVVATGGTEGAGIGGGSKAECGPVSIAGGEVHATGGTYGAGIGGGRKKTNGTVTITGGTVYAKGTVGGAGIGGGTESDCSNDITIRQGAVVTADGSPRVSEGIADCGAGIGGGAGDTGTGGDLESTVTIEGSTVTARAGIAESGHTGGVRGGAGIGAGAAGNAKDGKVYITDATIYAYGSGGSGDDDRGGAGIGGGAEEYGHGGEGAGLVEIKGLKTVVVAQAGYGSCSAIGHGDNDGYMGELTIEDKLKVQAGNDGTNYERLFLYGVGGKDERAAACKWRRSARIEACDHPNPTFASITAHGHWQNTCVYCNQAFTEEEHSFDKTNTCQTCGYRQTFFALVFDGGGAGGTMNPLYIADGKSVNLPDCGFDIPKGKAFAGWEIGGTTYPAGKPYTPVANATAKALWTELTATVSFDVGTDEFAYTGSMAPDVTKVGEKYELPDCGFVPANGVQANFVAWKVEGGTPDTGLKHPFDKIDVMGDVTVTAQWQRYWVVAYDLGDGSEPEDLEIDDGGVAPEPAEPEWEGYVFLGWTLDGAPYEIGRASCRERV